jgi:hypothetical protein
VKTQIGTHTLEQIQTAPSAANDQRLITKTGTLTPELLHKMNSYWRAANYLSVGQIYLYDNPQFSSTSRKTSRQSASAIASMSRRKIGSSAPRTFARGRVGRSNMQAYEACISATSMTDAPWYVVPADDKEDSRVIVSQIVLAAFNELKMAYPKITTTRRQELKSIRNQL